MNRDEEIRDLASLLAEVIRRAGAAYGSPQDWRRDFTQAVKISDSAHLRSRKKAAKDDDLNDVPPSGMDEYGSLG